MSVLIRIDHYFEKYCTCCRQWPHLYPAPTGLSTYNTLAFLFHENLFRVALALVLENSGKGRSSWSWDLVLLPLRHLLVELSASLLTAVALIGPFSLNRPYSEVAPGPPWNEWGWSIQRFENCLEFIETITIYNYHKTTNDQLKSMGKVWAFVITTLQSMMNTKLSKQRFWHCYENGLIKTIQTLPHIIKLKGLVECHF